MTNQIGPIVAWSLIAGRLAAIILVAIPFAGGPEICTRYWSVGS